MKPPVKASDFPELQRVFSGYLHEDFVEEHGTAADALRAFREDADSAERRRFAKEARRFLNRTKLLSFDELRPLLQRLGCRWTPPSREALIAALDAASGSSSG